MIEGAVEGFHFGVGGEGDGGLGADKAVDGGGGEVDGADVGAEGVEVGVGGKGGVEPAEGVADEDNFFGEVEGRIDFVCLGGVEVGGEFEGVESVGAGVLIAGLTTAAAGDGFVVWHGFSFLLVKRIELLCW